MTHTDCWYDPPRHHEPAHGRCESPVIKGEIDCQAVLKSCLPSPCDQERFRRNMQEMEERLHHCGVLPPVQIGCEPRETPATRPDTAGSRTDCFGYMHVPDFGFPRPVVIGRQDEHHGCHEAPAFLQVDAHGSVNVHVRGGVPMVDGHPLDPLY